MGEFFNQLKRIAGVEVAGDHEAQQVMSGERGDKIKQDARFIAKHTEAMPNRVVYSLFPDLDPKVKALAITGDGRVAPNIQREAAVFMAAEKALRAFSAPRPGDTQLSPHIRKNALHTVVHTDALYQGGGSLQEHLGAKEAQFTRCVDHYLATGKSRYQAIDIEAQEMLPGAQKHQPTLTLKDVSLHLRNQVIEAHGTMRDGQNEVVASRIVSRAISEDAEKSYAQAGMDSDPTRVSHMHKYKLGMSAEEHAALTRAVKDFHSGPKLPQPEITSVPIVKSAEQAVQPASKSPSKHSAAHAQAHHAQRGAGIA